MEIGVGWEWVQEEGLAHHLDRILQLLMPVSEVLVKRYAGLLMMHDEHQVQDDLLKLRSWRLSLQIGVQAQPVMLLLFSLLFYRVIDCIVV